MTAEKLVKRLEWSTKKKRKYANKIADTMESNGKIRSLYQDFRNEINIARDSKSAFRARGRP
jgi:hypothetical protein